MSGRIKYTKRPNWDISMLEQRYSELGIEIKDVSSVIHYIPAPASSISPSSTVSPSPSSSMSSSVYAAEKAEESFDGYSVLFWALKNLPLYMIEKMLSDPLKREVLFWSETVEDHARAVIDRTFWEIMKPAWHENELVKSNLI